MKDGIVDMRLELACRGSVNTHSGISEVEDIRLTIWIRIARANRRERDNVIQNELHKHIFKSKTYIYIRYCGCI